MALSTQQKILRIAAELFAERGYADTNMREVADRAGLSLPTIYHHFGNKDQLYQSACTSVFRKKATTHLSALNRRDALSDKERLLSYYTALAEDLARDRIYFNLLYREFLSRNAHGQAKLSQDSFNPAFSEVARICERICPDRNPVVLALSLHGMLMGLTDVLRFGVYLDERLVALRDPTAMARLSLFNLLPHIDWGHIELEEEATKRSMAETANPPKPRVRRVRSKPV